MQYLRKLHIENPYTTGAPVIKIPLGGKILQSRLILRGPIVLAGGAAVPVIGEGAPVELFKRIQLIGTVSDGRYEKPDEIVDCSARSLVEYAITQRGKKLTELSTPAVALANGAANTYQVYCEVPIYFADNSMRRNKGTALNSDAYSSLQLKIDFAKDLSTCLNGYAGTVDLSGLEFLYEDERVYTPGDTDVLIQSDNTQLIGAAQKKLQFSAMPTSGKLLQLLIMAEANCQSVRTLSDAILNKIRFVADQVDYEKEAKSVRFQMFDDEWFDASVDCTGLYFFDFADGAPANSLDLKTFEHYFDVSNPSGANNDQLRYYTRRAFRVDNYAAAVFAS